MKIIRKKFHLFGILLTLSMVIGLTIQHARLNDVITKDKQSNIIKSRENLARLINEKMKFHSQFTIASADFIATDKWTEEEVVDYFSRLVKSNSTLRSIYYGDINNKLIINDDWDPPSDFDLRTRTWYVKAVEDNKLIISEIYVNALENRLIVTISMPVYEGNTLRGVVATDINIENIITIVEDTTIKGLGYSFLIDSAGNILAHPKYKYTSESEIVNINSLSNGISKEIMGGDSGQIETKFDGVEGYLSYQAVEGTDWIIGNFMSEREFRGDNSDLVRMFFIALGIAITIFISFSYFQRKHIILPLMKLDNDIININLEDNLGYRLPINKADPFLELRNSINSTLNKTQELFEQTEQDTEEIMAQNTELEASYNQLTAMGHELRQQYERIIKSEEGLKKALERNKAMIRALPDILFTINKEGILTDIQATADIDLYLVRENNLGKNIKDIFPQDIIDSMEIKIRNVLKNNVLETLDYGLDKAKGYRHYEIRISKINEDEVMAVRRNITEGKKLQDELSYLSYHDQLTGLYNRRYFVDQLKKIDIEENLPISIIMADVNGLKLMNDSFGHHFGDELLVIVANVLREGCRVNDLISRVSGDEFVVVLLKTNEIEAEGVIDRIKKLGSNKRFSDSKLSNFEISVSYGLGTKNAKDVYISEILKKAEDNMYSNKLFEGPSMRSRTIDTIIRALYEKNKREEQHSTRVAKICQEMGIHLGFKEDEIKELEKVGLLHDIGKIAISEAVLNKPGSLNQEEWEEIKKHPEIGYRILSTLNEMTRIAEYTLAHHERYDGKGYPRGLKGDKIPLVSRIIAIADSYDAMACERPYKRALLEDEIVAEFIRNAGTQFDPELTKVFVEKILGYDWKEDIKG